MKDPQENLSLNPEADALAKKLFVIMVFSTLAYVGAAFIFAILPSV